MEGTEPVGNVLSLRLHEVTIMATTRPWRLPFIVFTLALLVAGCGADEAPMDDGGDGLADAGPPPIDAGDADGGAEPDARVEEDAGALVELGAACGEAAECLSGACVDGLCCEGACDGLCESCALPGLEGTCAPHAPGLDPDLECGGGVCDGAGACALGAVDWAASHAATAGVGNNVFVNDVVVDEAGVVIVGQFRGVVGFGGPNLVASGGNADVFVARYAPDGTHLHSRRFGTNISGQNTVANAVALTPSGSVVVVGHYGGLAGVGPSFGGGSLPHAGRRDLFVVELDDELQHVRSVGFGGAGDDEALAVAVANDGRVLVGGEIEGEVAIGDEVLRSEGGADALVLSLDDAFAPAWAVASGGALDEAVRGLDVDSLGGAVVAGSLRSAIAFGGTPVASAGFDDLFLARLDVDGALDWLAVFGDEAGQQIGHDVAVGPEDRVVLVGSFLGTVDVGGPAPLVAEGATLPDFLVASFDREGQHLWSRRIGDVDLQNRIEVDVNAAGDVAIATGFEGVVDFGGGPLTSAGQGDVSLTRLTLDGAHLWSAGFGDGFDQHARGVAVAEDGSTVVVGKLLGRIDFGLGPLEDAGAGFAAFVARFDP
jgi:hypothetical protein